MPSVQRVSDVMRRMRDRADVDAAADEAGAGRRGTTAWAASSISIWSTFPRTPARGRSSFRTIR